MAHYDKQEEKTSRLRQVHTLRSMAGFKGYVKDNNIKGMPNNIPWGNTEDLFNHTPSTLAQEIQDEIKQPLKHIEGKAEGARYCFIPSLVQLSEYQDDDNLLNLSYIIDEIANEDYSRVNEIYQWCYCGFDTRQELWDGVIKLRYNAIQSGKYRINSYKEPLAKTLLVDAMARHLIKYLFIDIIDEDSGQNHLCHIVANAIILNYQSCGEKE